MAGLQGLSGIGPVDVVIPVSEATAEQAQGGSADPRHALGALGGVYGYQLTPGVWQAPYGTANQIIGTMPPIAPAGAPLQDPRADLTPDTHGAPWPTLGLADSVPVDGEHAATDLQRMAAIHASDTGASQEVTYNIAEPAGNWGTVDYTTPGVSMLATGLPRQLMGNVNGIGSTDRIHGMARQNEYGFDSAHVYDRRSRIGVPGNYMWMRPGGRPLVIEPHGQTNMFDGQDSPFAGHGLQVQTRTVRGGILQNQPTAYTPPPEPLLAPPLDQGNPVWSSW